MQLQVQAQVQACRHAGTQACMGAWAHGCTHGVREGPLSKPARPSPPACFNVYTYIYIYTYIHIHVYIYIERERDTYNNHK